MPTKKYLIETSAVRGCVGPATRAQESHFQQETSDGELRTSIYLRKEFIDRWVCDFIRFACTIAQCSSVSEALTELEQDFKPRNLKGILAVLAKFLHDSGSISNTKAAAEEAASMAVRFLRSFDLKLPSRINNRVGCKIGGRTIQVDYNCLLDDLQEFYKSIKTPITDCPINDFLKLGKPHSKADEIIDDASAQDLSVIKTLAKYREEQQWITCKECAKIGDAVIALEHPKSSCLVHVDNSFNVLCQSRPHKQLKSVTALSKEQRENA